MATASSEWESYEPESIEEQTGRTSEWEDYDPEQAVATPTPEVEEITPWGLAKGSVESLYHAVKDVPKNWTDLQRNLLAGAMKTPGEVGGFLAEQVENLPVNVMNVIQDVRGEERQPYVNPVSDWMRSQSEQVGEMIRPEDQGTLGRIAEEVGAYALPSAGLTQMMINSGKLIAGSPKFLNAFENMLVDVAKNPKAAQALDQTLSALMATSGQLSEEAGLSPMQRALVEMGTGIFGGFSVPWVTQKAKGLMMRTKEGTKVLSKQAAGKYLNDVVEEDPYFWKMYEKNKLAAENRGIDLDLPELANNPELKAAKRALLEKREGGATRELTTLKQQSEQVRQAFDFDENLIDDAALQVKRDVANIERDLTIKFDEAEKLALKEAQPFNEASIRESGNAALVRLDEAEALMNTKVAKLYGDVGLDTPMDYSIIRKGIETAKKSALAKNEWGGEIPAQLKNVMDDLLVSAAEKPTSLTVALGAKKKPTQTITLRAIQELQSRLKDEIRSLRPTGKTKLIARLSKVLNSTYKQLDQAKGLSQDNADLLKQANRQSKIAHERFSDARIEVLNKVDKQGLIKTATEDVVANIIKTNGQKNSERAVTAYQNAIGDQVKSKEILRQGFIAKLAVNALKKPAITSTDKLLNVKATQNFLDQHKNFLKASGLENEFKDPAAASRAMDSAQETLMTTVDRLARSEASKWVGSDDLVQYVSRSIKSGKIKTLLSDTANKPLVQRGIREAAWVGTLRDANVTRGMRGFEKDLNPEALRTAMQNNIKSLKKGLGERHFKDAREMMRIIDSIIMDSSTTAGFVVDRSIEDLTEKLLVGLRAAAHGFVRPELIVAQAGKRVFTKISSDEARKQVIDALVDPVYAKELIKLYKSGAPGKEFVRASLAPFAMSGIDQSQDQ